MYHHEAFGSRYVTWTNNVDAIRLIWDGKDDWFWLNITNDLPLSFKSSWNDLIYKPYDPRVHDAAYVEQLNDIVNSIAETEKCCLHKVTPIAAVAARTSKMKLLAIVTF
jgi:hypothetical protein